MKKKLGLLAISMLSLFFVWCSSDLFQDPVQYNDTLIDYDLQVVDIYNEFRDYMLVTSLDTESLEIVDEKRVNAADKIKDIKNTVEAIWDYKWDLELRDIILKDINMFLWVFEEELSDLIALRSGWNDIEWDIPQDQIDAQDTLIDSIDTKIWDMETEVITTQESFAERHGYDLETYTDDYAE